MKKTLLTTLACGFLLAFSSCDKIEEAIQQDVSITPNTVTFSIDKINTTTTVTNMDSVTVNLNLDSLVKKNASGFGAANIKSIKLKSFSIVLDNADNDNNFANFESINAQIQATGQSPVELVSVSNNPDTYSNTLSLKLSNGGLDLKQYLSGTFKYKIQGKARRVTTKVLKATATAKYTFTVGL